MPDNTVHSGDPVAREVVRLVLDIRERHLSEAVAVERIRSPEWVISVEQAERITGMSCTAQSAGYPIDAYLYALLALEASDVRWGRTRSSPWWLAADALVDAARLSLAIEPDSGRFHLACDVVDEQIALLRAVEDIPELARTLFAAGILRVHPHTAGLLDVAASLTMRERQVMKHWRRSVLIADRRRPEWDSRMPHALDCALEALPYLHEAVDVSEGNLKGRYLTAVVEALNLIQTAAPQPDSGAWTNDVKLHYSREALGLLDLKAEPHALLQVRRLLAAHGEAAPIGSLSDLLPFPVAELPRRYGDRQALAMLDQALHFLRERGEQRLLGALVAEVQQLPGFTSAEAEDRRGLWEAQVHVLTGGARDCPAPDDPVDDPADCTPSDSRDGCSPENRAVELFHLAAHLYERRDCLGAMRLIERAEALSADLVGPDQRAVAHLSANVRAHAGTVYQESGEAFRAVKAHAAAVLDYSCVDLVDPALHELDLLVDCATEAGGAAVLWAAGMLSFRLVQVLPTVVEEEAAVALNFACQRLAAGLVSEKFDAELLWSLVTAAKGFHTGAALHVPGPRPHHPLLVTTLDRIAELEARETGPAPPRLDELSEDLQLLCYTGSLENSPGASDAQYLDNLRRTFDRESSLALRALSEPGDPVRSLTPFGDVQRALGPETVLVNIFMGIAPGCGSRSELADADVALYVLAITRESFYMDVVPCPGLGAGFLTVSADGYSHLMHPLAQIVSHLRAQILTDPLHRPVTREAEDDLRLERLFGEIAVVLPALRRSGKTHLCFWGHGPFHYLPFPLLHLEGQSLADTWTVTSVPSLSSVMVLRADADTTAHPRGEGLLTIGAALGGAAWDLPAEPSLEEHARMIARVADGTALTGPQATPANFLARAPGCRYLHIAAHGSLDQAAPSFQCLYLNPPDGGAEGRLFTHQVLTMDLRGVELVTLSACESALGRFDLVDDVRGLTAAFLLAGAEALVGCLWPVRTPVATHFFSALYEAMWHEGDARSAFRHAQQSTRETFPQYRDWGTFACSGAWRPLGERVPRWT